MSTVRELLQKLVDHYTMMEQQLESDHLLSERCNGAKLMCKTLQAVLPEAVLEASSSITENEGKTKLVELPEKIYIVTQLKLPPDGVNIYYYVQEVVPESLERILQLQKLHDTVFFSEEAANKVCEEKNKNEPYRLG